MDKKQAENILNQLNEVGKKLGYRDVTVNCHFLVGIEKLLKLLPRGDSESRMSQQVKDYLDILTALQIVSN